PSATLFPYTTLFRSDQCLVQDGRVLWRRFLNCQSFCAGIHKASRRLSRLAEIRRARAQGLFGLFTRTVNISADFLAVEFVVVGRSEEHTSELQSPCN